MELHEEKTATARELSVPQHHFPLQNSALLVGLVGLVIHSGAQTTICDGNSGDSLQELPPLLITGWYLTRPPHS